MSKENIFNKLSGLGVGEQCVMGLTLADDQIVMDRDVILKGRPRKRKNATTMTVSLDQADKEKIKLYAYSRSLTVSDLIHQWINEKCEDVNKG